jgi:hypothetical protein
MKLFPKPTRLKRDTKGKLNMRTGFIQKREPVEGLSSKKARAHCHAQV